MENYWTQTHHRGAESKIMKNTEAELIDQDRAYIDKSELARLLGVCRRTIDNLMKRRRLPFYKITRKLVRFRRDDVEKYLRQECRIGGLSERF